MFKFSNIRGKTMLTILPIMILTLIAMTVISYKYSESQLSAEIQNKMSAKLQGTITDIEKQLTAHGTLVHGVANTIDTAGTTLSTVQIQHLLQTSVKSSDVTFGSGLFFEPNAYRQGVKYYGPYAYRDNGQVVYTDEYSDAAYDYLNQDWYKTGMNSTQNIVWTDPYYDPVSDVTMLTACVPLHDSNGNFMGVATGDLDFITLKKIIDAVDINMKSQVYLFNNQGQYLINPDSKKTMKSILEESNQSLSKAASTMFSGKEGMFTYTAEGARRVYYAPIPEFGWILAIDVSEADLLAPLKSLLSKMLLVFALAIVVTATVLYLYSRYIVNNVKSVNQFATAIAQGDLSQSVEVRSKDEFGQMSEHLNTMMKNFREIIEGVVNSSQQVAASAEELTASADEGSRTTEQIAYSIQEVSDGVKQKLAGVDETAKSAQLVSGNMQTITEDIQKVTEGSIMTADQASAGNSVVRKAVDEMQVIGDKVAEAAGVVNTLGIKSGEIGQIVALITDIAAQTNLLALNAAIEAARAGEQGRGFAVVAEEVRKLAEQSSDAAGKISGLIGEIQNETTKAVRTMNDGTEAVQEGISMVNSAGEAFQGILQGVNDFSKLAQSVADVVQQVGSSTEEIVASIMEVANIPKEIAGSLENVVAGTEEQSASMEEIRRSANSLAQLATDFQSSVSTFKL
ncbi:methyl-accepting chemotaxis protein [Desulfosporosinus orientis DSM 765]|uniref:Methyl-accepting chemotaxis protein n=1 Tax=Desulfosporosinus orientis (strain ATCC 19365 / DSM 765 / NCIMB 8382 / VKM B-1628 / Singapore I) TaxID=768706 RepID=G7W5B4_DESOD|nr:methyl-accepting chemotaxis protein [Desulfosporosinus orientis]AET66342.1 methyl-accepting chemotaxis protein [Desulfosporosinus orientis DSM 765]